MKDAAGQIDTIAAGEGFAVLRGRVSAGVADAVQNWEVLCNGRRYPVRLNVYQPSAGAGSDVEHSAFVTSFPLPVEESELHELLLRGGDREILLSPEASGVPFEAIGHIERFEDGGLRGWVYDAREYAPHNQAVLRVNGAALCDLPLTEARGDVRELGVTEAERLGFFIPVSTIAAALSACAPQSPANANQPVRFEIICGDRVLFEREARLPGEGRVRGRLEGWSRGEVQGWAFNAERPDEPVAVDIFIDGIRYQRALTSRTRSDLVERGWVKRGGGFSVPLRFSPTGAATVRVSARVVGADEDLISAFDVDLGRIVGNRAADIHVSVPEGTSPAIVVPIFNAYDQLVACLESLETHTTTAAKLILIDDCSTDPRIGTLLRTYMRRPNVTVIRKGTNEGFTRTVNQGLQLAGRSDVVLLNSDTCVTPRWLENLRLAAYSHERIATATPLSDNAGAFSVPLPNEANARPDGLGAVEYARAVTQNSHCLYPRVPTGNGFCLYIRRDALDAIGVFDAEAFPRGYGEETDFCLRAGRAGWLHVIDDRTLIYHARSASFGEERIPLQETARDTIAARYPEYGTMLKRLSASQELACARYGVSQLGGQTAAPQVRPRILFVLSVRTGGTPQTNRDLIIALQEHYEPWVLYCDASRMELFRFHQGQEVGVAARVLLEDVAPQNHGSSEYDRKLQQWLIEYAIEMVHVRHIAFHSLGLANVCQQLSIPLVFSFHDFYTICPTVKLLDESLQYCGGTCTPGAGPCIPELWRNDAVPPLKHRWISQWHELMETFLKRCDAFVTTSPGAWETLCANHPFLRESPARIIPHGRSFARFSQLAVPYKAEEPLRIVVPGNISAAKGANLIAEIATIDSERRLEFHILGDAAPILKRPGVVLHGRYERDEILERVAALRPHIGGIFSIWPETYCHTLTELWACGLPVFAFPFGAVGERVQAVGAGWLASSVSAEEVYSALRSIVADPGSIASKVEEVLRWQTGPGSNYGTKAMAAEYRDLYNEVWSRRNFCQVGPGSGKNSRIPQTRTASVQHPSSPQAVKSAAGSSHREAEQHCGNEGANAQTQNLAAARGHNALNTRDEPRDPLVYEAHPDTWVSYESLGGVSRPYRPTIAGFGSFIDEAHRSLAAAPRRGVLIDLGIPGWLQVADALKLYELAYFAEGNVLEFGTNHGLSASIIARALRARPNEGNLTTVELNAKLAATAKMNLASSGASEVVEVIEGDASCVAKRLVAEGREFGFCFVDHSHAFENVNDICLQMEGILSKGGFVLFHDFTDKRNTQRRGIGESGEEYGVYAAVEEAIDKKVFDFYGVYGCAALFRRRSV